jgi:hypothetical protein
MAGMEGGREGGREGRDALESSKMGWTCPMFSGFQDNFSIKKVLFDFSLGF